MNIYNIIKSIIFLVFLVAFVLFIPKSVFSQSNLSLQGIIDFTTPSFGNTGKAIHVKALQNIPDLSIYGIGVANNGGGSDGEEYNFDPIPVLAGEDILVARDVSVISSYFSYCFSEFDHVLQANTNISQNGDDAIELFMNGLVVETFGDVNVDGTGEPWEYLDSWAYKDPSGSVTFSGGNWIFGGVECTIGSLTTQTSSCPYPSCDASVFITEKSKQLLSVYPNPSADFIFLDSELQIDFIEIHNVMGEKISNYNLKNEKIKIAHLPKGLYILSLFDNVGDKIQKKFIKN